jgi:hypothetical protein
LSKILTFEAFIKNRPWSAFAAITAEAIEAKPGKRTDLEPSAGSGTRSQVARNFGERHDYGRGDG